MIISRNCKGRRTLCTLDFWVPIYSWYACEQDGPRLDWPMLCIPTDVKGRSISLTDNLVQAVELWITKVRFSGYRGIGLTLLPKAGEH